MWNELKEGGETEIIIKNKKNTVHEDCFKEYIYSGLETNTVLDMVCP